MSIDAPEVRASRAAGLDDAAPLPLHRTLLARVVVVMLVLVAAMGAVLLGAVDYFVRLQFRTLHQEQLQRQAREVVAFLDNEKRHFARLVEFIASDSDLVHATQYHLFLRGENKAMVADVQRMAATFDLALVAVREGAAAPVAVAVRPPLGPASFDELRLPADEGASAIEAVWAEGRLWLVASAPVRLPGRHLVRLWIARPLAGLFSVLTGAMPGHELRVLPADSQPTATGVLVPVRDLRGAPVALEVPVRDAVQEAIHATVRVLAVLLLVTAGLLALVLAWHLRRELAPIHALTRSAAAVGRGELDTAVPVRGEGEVARLAHVFNRMVRDLGRLRALEESARHEERLTGIGRLATRVAHDINNPLTVIKNAVRLAQRRDDVPAGVREELTLIGHNCDRCIGIVESLLRFGRPLRLRTSRFDLAALVEASVERFRRQRAGVRLVCDVAERPVWLRGDAFQIEQLLENLLTNACDAGPAGEVTVGLRPAGAGQAQLSVHDRGPGFSDEALAHLAEPFFTTKAQGTGLGLASCMAIARAHGGTLRARNEGGAAVTVMLPLDPVPHAP